MRMKINIAGIALGIAFSAICGQGIAKSPAPEIARKPGRLGIPHGTEARVEVEIVRASEAGHPELAGEYLLRVTKINDTELISGQAFKFTCGKGVENLPSDAFELYKAASGKTVDELPAEELKRAEEGFVGRRLAFLASELPAEADLKDKNKQGISKLMLLKSINIR